MHHFLSHTTARLLLLRGFTKTALILLPGMLGGAHSAYAASDRAARTPAPRAANLTVQGRIETDGQFPATDWMIVAQTQPTAVIPKNKSGRPYGIRPQADGQFTLTNLSPVPQFLCLYFNGRLDVGSVIKLHLDDGENREKIVLKPEKPVLQFQIDLYQEDTATAPAKAQQNHTAKRLGRRVRAHLYNSYGAVDATPQGTLSDQNGVLNYGKLPAGMYSLWVESQAKASGRQAQPGTLVETIPITGLAGRFFRGLDVKSDSVTHAVALSVPPAAAATGKLMLADGKTPAAGYTIAVQSAVVPDQKFNGPALITEYARGAKECYAEARVQSDGTFLLNGLTKGTHAVDIRRPGERTPYFTIPVVPAFPGEAMSIGTWNLPRSGWQMMFDGRTLNGWKETDFAGHGEVHVGNSQIMLLMGNDMTGITRTGDLLRTDYELTLEAMRVDGSDFFCGLTFPVGDSPCSLILGGWGGSVVGLSSLDNLDASENETTKVIEFQQQRWYRIRLRVTKPKIEAWLDDEKIIEVDLEGKRLSVRYEMEQSRPLGIATWRTTGAIRDIRQRPLEETPAVK